MKRQSGRLDGRVAVVTGGSGGIGRATCVAFAAEGARVVAVGRNRARVRETLAAITEGCPVVPDPLGVEFDVSSEEDMGALSRRVLDEFSRVDILVACAGIGKGTGSTRAVPYAVTQLPVAEWDEILGVNLRGVFLSNRAVLPAMTLQGAGDIRVNVSSSPGGIRGQALAAAYCASKFAVAGFSEALAAEVGPLGIRVQVVFPDLVDTPLVRDSTLAARLGAPLSPDRVAEYIALLVGLPRDIVSPPSRRYGAPVLRRLPENPVHWAR